MGSMTMMLLTSLSLLLSQAVIVQPIPDPEMKIILHLHENENKEAGAEYGMDWWPGGGWPGRPGGGWPGSHRDLPKCTCKYGLWSCGGGRYPSCEVDCNSDCRDLENGISVGSCKSKAACHPKDKDGDFIPLSRTYSSK